MTSSTSIAAIQNNLPSKADFHALFADIEKLEPFDIKKQELSAQLAALLSYAAKNRSELAEISGWKRSRITNILNGNGNLTFKTIYEFARYLGYEADLIFRRPNEVPAKQPWKRVEYLPKTEYHDIYVYISQNTQSTLPIKGEPWSITDISLSDIPILNHTPIIRRLYDTRILSS